MNSIMLLVGSGLAIGLTGLGVCVGQGMVASASLEAMGKNPELESSLKKMTILGLALVESAAIYGLLIALFINYVGDLSLGQTIGASLAVGLPGLAAGISEGFLVKNAVLAILRNPSAYSKISNNMMVFVALVESAAIYGFVMAMLIVFS